MTGAAGSSTVAGMMDEWKVGQRASAGGDGQQFEAGIQASVDRISSWRNGSWRHCPEQHSHTWKKKRPGHFKLEEKKQMEKQMGMGRERERESRRNEGVPMVGSATCIFGPARVEALPESTPWPTTAGQN